MSAPARPSRTTARRRARGADARRARQEARRRERRGGHGRDARGPSAAELLAPLVDRVAGRLGRRWPLRMRFWDGSALGPLDGPAVVLRDPVAISHLLRAPGDLGLGRAWVTGAIDLEGNLWEAMDRAAALGGAGLTARDRVDALAVAARLGALRPAPIPETEARPQRHGRRHVRRRDSEAIQHHYDVGNAFYRLVLGPTLVYSCAYFDDLGDGPLSSPGEAALDDAQTRKLDLVCRKLDLRQGERLLDVGCGWGSLVIHAAQRFVVSAVGVTASPAQAELARERVREAGLEDRVEIRVQDYRDVADGPYDAIASVGMYEHVGAAALPTYAGQLFDLLRPGGRVLNHGITRLHDEPTNQATFVDRYVFPDGELHRIGSVVSTMEQAGLEVRDAESLREHYARTLRGWVDNLEAHREEAVAEAGVERERIWRLYMAASAAMFERGRIGIVQTLAVKPGAPHGLAPTRAGHLRASA